jgi:2-iminoacetate synthase
MAAVAHALEANPTFLDMQRIRGMLQEAHTPQAAEVREVIAKAGQLAGLSLRETALLLQTEDPQLIEEMFAAARAIKNAIYGKRVVLFAPLYYSSYCANNCLYCAFRRDNPMPRRRLTLEQVAAETRALEEQGHKRLLVIAGESAGHSSIDYLLQVIETVYATHSGRGEIRRVNVEMAPMSVEDFKRLKAEKIGTYVLFQETYDPKTYAEMHPCGPKADYGWRLGAMDRAMAAGIDDVGIGTLFGLNDYREEVLGLLVHAQHLERTWGAGPHTISVPRLEPAAGAPAALNPPHPVSDQEFKKIVAILRMAVPYTGMILSTRESAPMRTALLDLGISQMSAGSCTEPGGYAEGRESVAQFSVGDHRTLDEVIGDIAEHGYVPSFCTGCYRKGRTGADFMELARPGLIRAHCLPNALLTYREYLLDYGSERSRALGERVIREQIENEVPERRKLPVIEALDRMDHGERDIYF